LHCTSALLPTSIGFLKIDSWQDVHFTFYDEIVSIILENGRGPWRNPFKEKRLPRNERIKFKALEHRILALSTAAYKCNLYCIREGCGSTVHIFIFLMILVWKNIYIETKFFSDKQPLANHRQELVK